METQELECIVPQINTSDKFMFDAEIEILGLLAKWCTHPLLSLLRISPKPIRCYAKPHSKSGGFCTPLNQ